MLRFQTDIKVRYRDIKVRKRKEKKKKRASKTQNIKILNTSGFSSQLAVICSLKLEFALVTLLNKQTNKQITQYSRYNNKKQTDIWTN